MRRKTKEKLEDVGAFLPPCMTRVVDKPMKRPLILLLLLAFVCGGERGAASRSAMRKCMLRKERASSTHRTRKPLGTHI